MPETALCKDTEFEALYERNWELVYRLCFAYMKDQEEAEDCAGDIFAEVIRGGYRFQSEEQEKKRLIATAAGQCRDRLRSRARKLAGSADDDMMPETGMPAAAGESDALERLIALPGRLKDAVFLRCLAGCGTGEIAALLGRPPSTVRSQLKDSEDLLGSDLGGDSL